MTKKILIADDSVTIQKVVQITFARQDAELICVDNGDDALAKAKALKPDIVLADVMMPGKDGYTLAKAIKSDPALAGVPVLLLAGSYEPFDEGKAKASGADGHIIKPFESQALLKKVEELSIGAPKGAATPAVAPPKAAAPPPPPPKAAPLPTLPHSGDSLEIEVAGEDSWDLSEEPAAPKAPPPMPAAKPSPPPIAAKPAAPAPRSAPPPPPPSLEVEVEVAGEDSWDLSEEPAAPKAPPPPPPKPAPPPMAAKPAAPPPRPAPPPPPVEEEVSVAGGDGWDLSEEPAAAAPPPDRMIEVEEPTLEPVHAAAHSLEAQMEVEVETPGMGGSEDDVWDLAEEKPIELDTTPKAVIQGVKTMAPAGDAWDLSEEPPAPSGLELDAPPPKPVARPEPVRPPPPMPAARPAPPPPMPAMAAAPSMGAPSVDAAALERTIREVVEREVAKALAEVTRAVSQEVRGQVAKIAEKLILEEIEKLKSEG